MVIRQSFLNLLFPFLIITSSGASGLSTEITGKVIALKDGDTIDILYHGRSLTIRLAHIDCPEKKQPYGTTAKKFMSSKCYGQIVKIQHQNKYDRNKRLIGVVINKDGENLNKELVKAGLAWHYKKYSSSTEYERLENIARKRKKGLWSLPNPVPPWKWRIARRN